MNDVNGREIREGDLLRTPHFRGARRQMFYLYHVAVLRDDRMFAVPAAHLAGASFVRGGGDCLVECLGDQTEIIDGYTNQWWHERPRVRVRLHARRGGVFPCPSVTAPQT